MFNKIYDLSYLPLLTPYNLLDNLKLDNYTSVNYTKTTSGIIAEVNCLVNKSPMSFYYEFDLSNNLNKIYYYEDNNIDFLFDRTELLDKYRKSYLKKEQIV